MAVRHVLIVVVVVTVSAGRVSVAQDRRKPLDPSKAKASYSFPLHAGSAPFHFTVLLDGTSTVTGVQVFRPGESVPFQTIPACKVAGDLTMELNDYDDELELLVHQDLNFDGFEDIQLLQYFVPHLAKSIYCVYIWSPQEGRFRHAPEIPDTNPIANPANKTITVHEDYFGGVFIDRTYRLSNGKPELVVENGRVSGSSRADCGFTDYCSRLINGKMVTTARRPSTCEHDEPTAVVCPSIIPSLTPAQRKK
jgi:hypothetical protein